MKPVSKKNRANANNSDDKKRNENGSCYDLKKLSEALDVIEAKTVDDVTSTAGSRIEKHESNSAFDLTTLSEALSAATAKDEMKLQLRKLKSYRLKDDIARKKRRVHVLLKWVNCCDEYESNWSEQGTQPSRRIPISLRLQRIVEIGNPSRRMNH